jgi:hypothetical protein
MNKRVVKFLEFKGKNLLFLTKDGIYWIAIKPVCEAIQVNFDRQFKTLKDDPILGPAYAVQPMQVPGDQVRNLACLPEHLIYGWIFSIRSESKELLEYKKECYNILFEFFHGAITGRKELIMQKAMAKKEFEKIEADYKDQENYIRLGELRAQIARIGSAMKRIDDEELQTQYDLFDQN